MGEFSLAHLLVIAFIALLLFGSTRIEGLGKSLGRAIRGFKQGINEIDADVKEVNSDIKKSVDARPGVVTGPADARQVNSTTFTSTSSSHSTSAGEQVRAKQPEEGPRV